MIMAMRLTRGLIGCVLIVLALTASISAAPETGAADPAITVRYSGTIDATREPMGEHPRGPDLHEVHFPILQGGNISRLRTTIRWDAATTSSCRPKARPLHDPHS